MNEERMDQALRQAAAEYHRPPETPRDEMWARIEAARSDERGTGAVGQPGRVIRFPVWRVVAAAAAVLVVGVAIGRITAPATPDGGTLAVEDPSGFELAPESQVAFRVAASDHLGRVELFLTAFRLASGAEGLTEEDYAPAARGLLSRTRMMRDSPIAQDLALAALLDDVELVLAQIAQYSGDRAEDLEFINQGIETRGVLLKLRSAIPAGPPQVAAQGAIQS